MSAPPPVPTGIQRLLRLAAIDASFLERLRESRDAVAASAGVELTQSERAILRAIPAEQLEVMARSLPPPEPPRRDFLRQTAAAAAVLLGGAALSSCETPWPTPTGARADLPPPLPLPPALPAQPATPPPEVASEADAGAPDAAPLRPERAETARTGGAAPDEPRPRRPERSPMGRAGGANPDVPGAEDPLDLLRRRK